VFSFVWGWASWANRWKNYDVSLSTFENANFINYLIKKKRINTGEMSLMK
jgi:hypothetical protein